METSRGGAAATTWTSVEDYDAARIETGGRLRYVTGGGYEADPFVYGRVQDIVAWTKELGIYCIIDWHVLSPGDPLAAEYAPRVEGSG